VETTSASAGPLVAERPSFLVRHQFLIYRLFSLAGLIPVGAYMVVHLLTNASIVNGPMSFQEQVDRIHSLGMALPLIEWVFIFIPIMFHATIGCLIISGAVPNTNAYPYAGNFRYTLQRATGMIAFAFIVFHVIQLHHFFGAPFKGHGGGEFDPHHAASSTAVALQPMWVTALYAIGMLACVYHFANGLWSQGITWGLWTSAPAQRRASWISLIIGVGLAIVGLSAIGGMRSVDIETARKIEDRMEAQKAEIEAISTDAAPVQAP